MYKIICMHLMLSDVFLYSSTASVSFWYNFGFLAFGSMVVQLMTGFFMACYYESSAEAAFDSLQFVTSEVKFMWLTSFVHANVASWVFLFVYLHVFKGLTFGAMRSYKELMWLLGTVILFLLLLVGFSGYSLVWGQMSYWALTVMTNLVTVIPIYGFDLLEWVWGNSVLTTYSLRRFYSLHFLLPFVVLALAMVHMTMGHKSYTDHVHLIHSSPFDSSSFGWTTFFKDMYSSWLFAMPIMALLLLDTNTLMCPDNWLYAMPYVTPVSIEPEWYFLPYYALLRSVPHKLLGFLLLVFGVVALAVLSLVSTYDSASNHMHSPILVGYILNFIYLGYMAVMPMGFPYIDVCLLLVWLHFTTLLVFL